MAALVVGLAGCTSGTGATPGQGSGTASQAAPTTATTSALGPNDRKVVIIAEENREEGSVIGNAAMPYLNSLAQQYGTATAVDAGYPTSCPSLPGYLLLTAGSTFGICDNNPATSHRLTGDNIFQQVSAAGGQWRGFAQSMPAPCHRTDDGLYASRHTPATYYTGAAAACPLWQLPIGDPPNALTTSATANALPRFTFVTPDLCHDLHGTPSCPGPAGPPADAWLQAHLPALLTSTDFTSGRLVIFIVWDEGSDASNHVPLIVLAAGAQDVVDPRPMTNCAVLRTTEELLGLPLLGCATTAVSLRDAFHL